MLRCNRRVLSAVLSSVERNSEPDYRVDPFPLARCNPRFGHVAGNLRSSRLGFHANLWVDSDYGTKRKRVLYLCLLFVSYISHACLFPDIGVLRGIVGDEARRMGIFTQSTRTHRGAARLGMVAALPADDAVFGLGRGRIRANPGHWIDLASLCSGIREPFNIYI